MRELPPWPIPRLLGFTSGGGKAGPETKKAVGCPTAFLVVRSRSRLPPQMHAANQVLGSDGVLDGAALAEEVSARLLRVSPDIFEGGAQARRDAVVDGSFEATVSPGAVTGGRGARARKER